MAPKQRPRRRPATTVEGREGQLVSLAVDLVEKQLIEGTASSQVITHYLKLGSTREALEQERLRNENLLLQVKAEQIQSAEEMKALYSEALDAMRRYAGQAPELEAGDDED
jgi:hypothetical protein